MWGLTSQPIRHSDKFWREFARTKFAPRNAQVGNSLFLPVPRVSTASFTRLSDPYSAKNAVYLFLPSLA